MLTLQPLVWVVDAQHLLEGQPLPEAQQQALEQAGLIVLNKSQGLDRSMLPSALQTRSLYWTEQGRITLEDLPQAIVADGLAGVLSEPPADTTPRELLLPNRPLRFCRTQEGHHALGWCWHPRHRFDGPALLAVLAELPGLARLKACLQLLDGWQAYNGLAHPGAWEPTLWRRDNRLELILEQMPDIEALEKRIRETIRDI
ncbi:hypothetical protein Q3H58_003090 [Pseudomonas psychrotolerans]|nr:hypothetical protein [Pseudomonas psychrotolerans]